MSNSERSGFWLPLAIGGPCVSAQGLKCASALLGECFGRFLPTLAALDSSYKCFPWLVSLICVRGAQPVPTVRSSLVACFVEDPRPYVPTPPCCATVTPCLLCSIGFRCGMADPSSLSPGQGGMRVGLD